jgi:hypothetical protein
MLKNLLNWLKTNRLNAFIAIIFATSLTSLGLSLNKTTSTTGVQEVVGNATYQGERGGTWSNYDQFTGFKTKLDPTKIDDGANANGQNTTVNGGDRISIRPQGYDLFPSSGTASSTLSQITSLHTFRMRDGTNILMRSYGTVVEYFEQANSIWEQLAAGFTSGQRFGFADNNINTQLTSYVYFGNTTEALNRWTGQKTLLNVSATSGAAVIYVQSTDGFLSSGSITLCGYTETYGSKTATQFNLSGTADADCADNRGVTETVATVSGAPKGNILMTADNRLWISGNTTTPQAVFFSKYGDATDFTTTTVISDNTDVSSGIFNLGEGGGGVTAMIQDESAIYMFKRSIIRRATLSDTIYTLGTLKPFDGRSQTIGAVGGNSTFTSGNEVFFLTPDNQVMRLARVEGLDYPQVLPISDVVKPTIDAADFSSSTGIVFKNKAYFAAKSTRGLSANDTVFVYNLQTQSWDSPIVGWAVSDFTVYDDGTGEKLYFGDAVTPNVYQVTDDRNDYIYDTAASWRSKQYTFGTPSALKIIDNVYVEGYISNNTDLTISLLLDENGYTQSYSTVLHGASSTYMFGDEAYNIFGLSPFGYERFGSNADQTGKRKFRVYLNKDFTPKPFYNASIEFGSDQQGADWEVEDYAFNVRPFTQQVNPLLFKSFK